MIIRGVVVLVVVLFTATAVIAARHPGSPQILGAAFWLGLGLVVLAVAAHIWFSSFDCCWISPAAFGGGGCATRDCEGWEEQVLGASVILYLAGIPTFVAGLVIALWRASRQKPMN
jgi:hypothetical protein